MTIKQIAKEAGVGVSTVSRYFNGGYVSSLNREKIKKVIDENNYVRNESALSLKGKSVEVAVIVQRIGSNTTSRFLEGIVAECAKRGLNPSFYMSNLDSRLQNKLVMDAIRKRKYGVVVYSFMEDFSESMIKDNEKIIIVGQKSEKNSSIYTEGEENYYSLVYNVIKNNSRIERVTTLGIELLDIEFANRIKGAKRASDDCNIEFNVVEAGFDNLKGPIEITKNTYYVCMTDSQAYSVLNEIINSGFTLGKDIFLSGYGNYEASKFLGITSIDNNYYEIGKEAIKMLESDKITKKKIVPEIIYRKSTNMV